MRARVVEQGPADAIFHRPRHPYTMGLLRSVPRLDRPRGARLETIEGLPPNLATAPPGCRFAPRCPYRSPRASRTRRWLATDTGGLSACIRAAEIAAGKIAWASAGAHGRRVDASTRRAAAVGARPDQALSGQGRPAAAQSAVVRAVEDVTFDIFPGETLGLVGESGCGKTTVGRLILRLEEPTAGEIRFDGIDLVNAGPAELKAMRRKVQVIFQDPYSSLNPRMTVGQIIGEPLGVYRIVPSRAAAKERVASFLVRSGCDRKWRSAIRISFPAASASASASPARSPWSRRSSSATRRCRRSTSRSRARSSICSKICSANSGSTYLFIAHDLAVVRHISMRVVVMYLGRVMEIAERDALYRAPLHPYTKVLLDAAPVPDPTVEKARAPRLLQGELPSALAPPPGCVFNTRCPIAGPECRTAVPPLREVKPGQWAACIKA